MLIAHPKPGGSTQMNKLLQIQLTRRTALQFAAWAASAVKAGATTAAASGQSPFADAVVVWHMADDSNAANRDTRLVSHGEVKRGIPLTGEDRRASLKCGGDGQVARFNGGWLDAGQGANGELNLTGGAITIAMRLRTVSGAWGHPLFGKSGGETKEIYYLFSSDLDAPPGMALAAEIGSDWVAGMHRVRVSIASIGTSDWHDVVMRFDGKMLELFVDGALHDNEVAVGALREGNREPCLIGAGIEKEGEPIKAGFRGLVDYVALWNRVLTDDEIAKLSGVTRLSDKRPVYYHEKYRPQFHFSAKKHWINDPNGLVYYKGAYHLFFQHMPPGRPGAYKDWGHAIGTDLVHWKQVRTPITPDKVLGGCWSGSAVVDWQNTAGFQKGNEKTLIAILTNGGEPAVGPPCTQCIAYSNDAGMTFTYYDGNPVLKHISGGNRDPKVFWHAPTGRWVMSLYLDKNDDKNEYALFGSRDLKQWEHLSDLNIPGTIECPDLFELPVDGDSSNKKWVFWGANGNHLIGTFDGRAYRKESDVQPADYGKSFYAAQTWNDIPAQDGRRIQIAWLRDGKYPGMPFTQQMNFPTELTLRTTADGIRLYRTPVRELSKLRLEGRKWSNTSLQPGQNLFSGVHGDIFEIRVEVEPRNATGFGVKIRSELVHFNAAGQIIAALGGSAPLSPEKGRITMQILVDRTSLEIFCNDGRVVLSSCFLPPDDNKSLEIYAEGSAVAVISAEVNPLRSIWP